MGFIPHTPKKRSYYKPGKAAAMANKGYVDDEVRNTELCLINAIEKLEKENTQLKVLVATILRKFLEKGLFSEEEVQDLSQQINGLYRDIFPEKNQLNAEKPEIKLQFHFGANQPKQNQ